MNSDTCQCCTCGYKWLAGRSGEHSCAEHLLKQVSRLEKEWKKENRIIELLIVGGFVTKEKVEEARTLLIDMP